MIYTGMVTPGALNWTVHADGVPLPPRNDLYDHSPDGLAWGYGGSGPAQLALALLAHFYVHVGIPEKMAGEYALRHHQAFKEAWVAGLAMDHGWEIDAFALAPIVRGVERRSRGHEAPPGKV